MIGASGGTLTWLLLSLLQLVSTVAQPHNGTGAGSGRHPSNSTDLGSGTGTAIDDTGQSVNTDEPVDIESYGLLIAGAVLGLSVVAVIAYCRKGGSGVDVEMEGTQKSTIMHEGDL